MIIKLYFLVVLGNISKIKVMVGPQNMMVIKLLTKKPSKKISTLLLLMPYISPQIKISVSLKNKKSTDKFLKLMSDFITYPKKLT